MRKFLSILALATIIMAAQSCNWKMDKNSEKESNTSVMKTVLMPEGKTALFENEKIERTEKRRIERVRLAEYHPTYTDEQGEVIYVMADVDPKYVGGEKEMMKYIRDNVKFPEDAQKRGEEGTVFVDFVVGRNGIVRAVEITDVESQDVDQSLKNEAVRVISSMPVWSPGRQQGDAVNVNFSIPITFQIM